MKSKASFAILLAMAAGSCASAVLEPQNEAKVTEKSFVSGGRIDMQLGGGNYMVRPAADNHIRVTWSGNTGGARVELTTNGTHANMQVKTRPIITSRRPSKCRRPQTS